MHYYTPLLLARKAALRVMLSGCVLALPGVAAADTYTITSYVIGTGAYRQTSSSCFSLGSTIGQPTFGAGSSTDFTLYAGFWRAIPPAVDSVFSAGFEDCGS